MKTPLADVMVIEFASPGLGAPPGQLLATLGANVIGIEPLPNLPLATAACLSARVAEPALCTAACKESLPPGCRRLVALQWADARAVALVLGLIDRADARVEVCGVEEMDRLGLTPVLCLQRRCRLGDGCLPVSESVEAGDADMGRFQARRLPSVGVRAALLEAWRSGQGQVVELGTAQEQVVMTRAALGLLWAVPAGSQPLHRSTFDGCDCLSALCEFGMSQSRVRALAAEGIVHVHVQQA